MNNCFIWGSAAVLWKDANVWWSRCPTPIIEVNKTDGVDATTLVQPWLIEPWNPYRAGEDTIKQNKKKRLIKLICKIRGQTYEEEKNVEDYTISVDDVKMTVNNTDINLNIKLEE